MASPVKIRFKQLLAALPSAEWSVPPVKALKSGLEWTGFFEFSGGRCVNRLLLVQDLSYGYLPAFMVLVEWHCPASIAFIRKILAPHPIAYSDVYGFELGDLLGQTSNMRVQFSEETSIDDTIAWLSQVFTDTIAPIWQKVHGPHELIEDALSRRRLRVRGLVMGAVMLAQTGYEQDAYEVLSPHWDRIHRATRGEFRPLQEYFEKRFKAC